MERRWFVFSNQIVRGPLTTENVEEGISTGRWNLETQIWWKGQSSWIAIREWRARLTEIQASLRSQVETQHWYLESKGTYKGPLAREELIGFLKSCDNPFQFHVWTTGLPQWQTIFYFPEILDELGVTRRAHPRAPVEGQILLHTEKQHPLSFPSTTISVGGVGVRDAKNITPGQTVNVTVQSPALPITIHSHAHVMYTRPDGSAGLKFDSLHIEAQSTIIDYVKQFEASLSSMPLPKAKSAA